MAEPRLIATFLTELRASAAKLADVDEVVAEVEDHLLTAVEAAVAQGCPPAEAEAAAIARFGTAQLIACAHLEEAKRGGAVSTRLTRRAGLAAMLAPLLTVIGALGNASIERGPLHGTAVSVLGAAFVAFALAIWGIRQRHGGLGLYGRVAFWLFVASPVLALPFGYGAGVALAFVQLGVVALLGVGMIQARILPVPAVGLFTLAPVATIAAAAGLTAAGVDAALYAPLGIVAFAVGLAWVGWVMWREPALDQPGRPDTGPLAA